MRTAPCGPHDKYDVDRLVAVRKSLNFSAGQLIIAVKSNCRFSPELACFTRWLLGKFILCEVIRFSAFVQPGCEWFAVGRLCVRFAGVVNISGIEPQNESLGRGSGCPCARDQDCRDKHGRDRRGNVSGNRKKHDRFVGESERNRLRRRKTEALLQFSRYLPPGAPCKMV